jgi:hypothetical protein
VRCAKENAMKENKNTIEDLKKLRDEVRIRIHLGEMEAKEWWAQTEPKLIELEESLERATNQAALSANVLIDEFAEAFRRIRDRLGDRN